MEEQPAEEEVLPPPSEGQFFPPTSEEDAFPLPGDGEFFFHPDEDWRDHVGDDISASACGSADTPEVSACGSADRPAADGSVATLIMGALMCLVCGKNQRMKNQIFCAVPCSSDVKACQRDAKAQGKEAFEAWKKTRRQGGPAFAAAIQTYKAKCAGFGRGFRRPSFGLVRYWMAIEFASRVQTGTMSLWLTKGAYCNMKKIDEECTAEEAALAWARELESLPASRISADRKILLPIESFVI